MNSKTRLLNQPAGTWRRQAGGITLFSGILILILMTQMLIYALQTGVFEQRKSANEVRQKRAFHIAESGIQAGKHFFAADANDEFIVQPRNDFRDNGDDGWLSPDGLRWERCSDADLSDETHPCNAENVADLRDDIYFYCWDQGGDALCDDSDDSHWRLPVNTSGYNDGGGAGEVDDRVEVYALLCMLDTDPLASPVVQGCTTDPAVYDQRYFLLTIAAKGHSDCTDVTDSDTCNAEALISDRFASYGLTRGGEGPGAPLVTKSTFPPGGTAEIVANPNGAGLGVAVSAWLNGRTGTDVCDTGSAFDPDGGSWATCERHEWYESVQMPDDFKCPAAQCSCGANERKLSYSDGNTTVVEFDIIPDPAFPCDLFSHTFGVEKEDYLDIKDLTDVLPDCSTLDATSSGTYWIEGDCVIGANSQIGSAFAPVFMIAAGSLTRFNGGAEFFGTLYVTDVENADAQFQSHGTNTIYGAGIIDGTLGAYTGTFQIVYLGDERDRPREIPELASVPGGWTDFHADWR